MTRSLDSGRQLSLMICAGTGHTAGKDLSSLRHALSQLSDILEINFIDSVNTECTNLLAASLHRPSGSFHDTNPPYLKTVVGVMPAQNGTPSSLSTSKSSRPEMLGAAAPLSGS